jgi:four helix bundle protein
MGGRAGTAGEAGWAEKAGAAGATGKNGSAQNVGTTLGFPPDVTNLRHHTLVAWQRADDLFIKLHLVTLKQFPAFERFELGSQLRKAAYSVPANIVEGFARRHRRARLHFLNIAEGSLAEVGYCLHVAHRLGYISEKEVVQLETELNGVGAPLLGLIRSTRTVNAVIPLMMFLCGVFVSRLFW